MQACLFLLVYASWHNVCLLTSNTFAAALCTLNLSHDHSPSQTVRRALQSATSLSKAVRAPIDDFPDLCVQNGDLSNLRRASAGFAAGITEALVVVTPFEVVKIKLQQQKGTSKELLRYRVRQAFGQCSVQPCCKCAGVATPTANIPLFDHIQLSACCLLYQCPASRF